MKTRSVYFVRAVFGLTTPCAYSQAVNATLLGTVTDSTGAVLTNTKVAIAEQNTGISHTGQTNESGNYTFPDVTDSAEIMGVTAFLETDRADFGAKIEQVQTAALPFGTQRSFRGLLNLVPGSAQSL